MSGTFYQYLKKEIPKDVLERVPLFQSKDIILIKPKEYVEMPETVVDSYQILLLSTTPPPLYLDKKAYFSSKKHALFIPPGVAVHSRQSAPSNEYAMLTANKSLVETIERSMGKGACSKIHQHPYSRKLWNLVQNIQEELTYKNKGFDLMVESLSTEFLIQYFRESRISEFSEKKVGQNHNYVKMAIDYMNTYYQSDISLDDLCRELNLSRYHFIRIFKEQTGVTPHAYLQETRLNKALTHIKNKRYSIEEVAGLCGYISRTHFSASFNRKYGVSPQQYRKTISSNF